jgi:plasmid stabilization system protein ParE
MKSYLITEPASDDLNQIWDYLAETDVRLADRILAAMEDAIRKLVKHPGLGHYRPDLTDKPLRFYLVYSYLIVYQPDTNPLEVRRVLHAARDIENLLLRTD